MTDQSGSTKKPTQRLRVPILGDWLMAVIGRRTMISIMALPENQGRALPDLARRYEEQMRYEGYLRSLLSTIRHFPMSELRAEYESVGLLM